MRAPALLCLALWLSSAASALAQNQALIERVLEDHGVAPTSQGVANFLLQGWHAAKPPKDLPERPFEKTDLLVGAWTLLALHAAQVFREPALQSVLADLSLRYARGAFPSAVQEMIDLDMQVYEVDSRSLARQRIVESLQYNGMVALGIFGNPNEETRAAARKVYDAETDALRRVAYAQKLALMGDQAVLDDLVGEVAKANRTGSVLAARALYVLTGRSFGYNANLAVGPRRLVADEIVAWWKALDKATLDVNKIDAIARQSAELPVRRRVLQGVRSLLQASADRADYKNERGSRTAWQQLDAAGDPLLEELKPVLADVDEDLDIRAEAVRWLVHLARKDRPSEQAKEKKAIVKEARRILKQLRKDPNPEIAKQAKDFLEKL